MQQQLFTFHSALMKAQNQSAEGSEAPKNWFIASWMINKLMVMG